MTFGFLIFLAFFAAVGISSIFKSRNTKEDYYLAGHSVSPWLVGLSAVATNNSGYMFIGVIGYTYATGLAAIWLMVGWLLGDLVGSLLVHRQVREVVERTGQTSYTGVLSHWYGQRNHRWQIMAALISLLFMLAYAGAQLVAGSKALHVLLDWPEWLGAVIGAVIVAVYCMAGGIRASIWTDAAQSFVMIFAMGLLLFTAVSTLGGVSIVIAEMGQVEGFLDPFPDDLILPGIAGGLIFIAGWFVAGLSVIGQPHVMVRFMTLDDPNNMIRARLWYYLWFTAFYLMATGVGLLSRLYIADSGNFDAELALPMMAQELLPPLLAGLVLAGIFAATMSTADSLLLACSSAVTHDLIPHNVEKTWLLRLVTVGLTLLALCWALFNKQSVFGLVIMAWSGLGSAFGGLLLVLAFGGKPGQRLMIAMSLIGFGVSLIWRLAGWHGALYEGLPGIGASILLFAAVSLVTKNPIFSANVSDRRTSATRAPATRVPAKTDP